MPHRARRVTAADYDRFDHLVVMDARNERGLRAIIPADPGSKVRRLLPGREVADPWYTGDFEAAWSDVLTAARRCCASWTGKTAQKCLRDFGSFHAGKYGRIDAKGAFLCAWSI